MPTTSHSRILTAIVICFARCESRHDRERASKPATIGSGSAATIRQITKSAPKNGNSQTSARV